MRKNEKQRTPDFLIRNMPISLQDHHPQQPKPLQWKKKISSKFIEEAIQKGKRGRSNSLRLEKNAKVMRLPTFPQPL